MTDPVWLTIGEAADLIRARKLSPVEYTQALLDRTAALNPRLNAFIRVTGDIIAFSPPLIAEKKHFEDIVSILGDALKRAA